MKNSSDIKSFVADTHCFIWHLTNSPLMSTEARRRFKMADKGEVVIFLSVITLIEILYLFEKKKIPKNLYHLLKRRLTSQPGDSYQVVDLTYDLSKWIKDVPRKVIPELPDRIITATALSCNLPLITKDKRIRGWEGLVTIW